MKWTRVARLNVRLSGLIGSRTVPEGCGFGSRSRAGVMYGRRWSHISRVAVDQAGMRSVKSAEMASSDKVKQASVLESQQVSLMNKVGALVETWPVASVRSSWQRLKSRKLPSDMVGPGTDTAQVITSTDTPPKPLHPTLQLIRERALSGSMPGQRHDNFKLGLAVEGGGMRGVVTGAMLMALQHLKLQNVFDFVYGASAGAINLTYYLAEQPIGLDIYTEDISNTTFLNPRRLLSSRPMMDLDFLVDYIMHEVKPLDWDAVLASPIPLKVVASSLDTLRPVVFSNFKDRTDLVECLKASATVPEIAGPYRSWRGHRLVDAAVFESVPFRSAFLDGCTHVLVLRSKPLHRPVHPVRKTIEKSLANAVKKTLLNPPYMRDAWRAELEFVKSSGGHADEVLAMAVEGMQADSMGIRTPRSQRTFAVHPRPAETDFHPLCIDVARLQQGRQEGYQALHRALAPVWQQSVVVTA